MPPCTPTLRAHPCGLEIWAASPLRKEEKKTRYPNPWTVGHGPLQATKTLKSQFADLLTVYERASVSLGVLSGVAFLSRGLLSDVTPPCPPRRRQARIARWVDIARCAHSLVMGVRTLGHREGT